MPNDESLVILVSRLFHIQDIMQEPYRRLIIIDYPVSIFIVIIK